jgi:hypothetical protein
MIDSCIAYQEFSSSCVTRKLIAVITKAQGLTPLHHVSVQSISYDYISFPKWPIPRTRLQLYTVHSDLYTDERNEIYMQIPRFPSSCL